MNDHQRPDARPEHSALDNGIDRLFHYQRYNVEYVKMAIRDRLIRFAPPGEFNDPWDCKPLLHVPEDEAGIRELVEFMYRASKQHTPHVDRDERAARAEHYLRNPDDLRKNLAEGSAEMWAQMNARYRLYCLSTKPDCPLMWAHWHTSTRLIVPPNITIIALPPKSPELNPVENIWQFMRS